MDEITRNGAPQALQGQWAALLHAAFRGRAQATPPARPRGPGLGVLALVAAASTAAAVALAAGVPQTDAERRHDAAARDFGAHRYAQAYGRFAELADAGHAPSAWWALMMLSQDQLNGSGPWSATPGQLSRWSALAMAELRERSAEIAGHDRGE